MSRPFQLQVALHSFNIDDDDDNTQAPSPGHNTYSSRPSVPSRNPLRFNHTQGWSNAPPPPSLSTILNPCSSHHHPSLPPTGISSFFSRPVACINSPTPTLLVLIQYYYLPVVLKYTNIDFVTHSLLSQLRDEDLKAQRNQFCLTTTIRQKPLQPRDTNNIGRYW